MNMPSELLLSCENVDVVLGGRRILNSISLALQAADRVALLGPSGCGKSTLLNVFAGLQQSSQGVVSRHMAASEIAFVFQEASLLPWKNVQDNALVLAQLLATGAHGVSSASGQGLSSSSGHSLSAPRALLERLDFLLDKVGLLARKKAFPDELSGGMKMRVALVRALMLEPRLLLLDEPFAALDDLTREQLQEELLELHASSGTAFVIVTHNINEALLLAQRIFVFSAQGSILKEIRNDNAWEAGALTRDSAARAHLREEIRQLWLSAQGEK